MDFYHKPVLLNECLEGLNIRPNGTYLDGTLGGGGHASEVLKRLHGGTLVGIDRDGEAIAAATQRLTPIAAESGARFTPLRGNFHDAKTLLRDAGIGRIDGALLDLGVSSHQLDDGERGFSYHADAALDMRMDQRQPLTAADIVNTYDQQRIARILRDYGEENWSARIAQVICDRRAKEPILTTGQLVNIIDAAIPRKMREKDGSHPARRTFQALRIAVNDELDPLSDALRDIADLLNPGGRLCVITFHSLEDRLVKAAFRDMASPCTCPPSFPVCVCGRVASVALVNRKPITASADELADNPRARSASLRVIEKLPTGGLNG